MYARAVTLSQFILQQERSNPGATGEFTSVLQDIQLAAKMINREVIRAGLNDVLGYTGERNIHGERVQKLDLFAHQTLSRVLGSTGQLAVMASEEDENIIPVPKDIPLGRYVVNFDPLDGSSNINAGVNIGTIFSVLPRVTTDGLGRIEDCLQPGMRQVCAGYVMYGSCTMLVYTTGHGVHGFTFEPDVGEFLLSYPDIRSPEHGRIYSVNEGNYARWTDEMKRYIDWLKEENEDAGRPYSARYIGSLVADFHRNLLYGGLYLYPSDTRSVAGKLRLLYEAAPLAFIAEQAGGAASDGHTRIMELSPQTLHQRTPLFIGSKRDVEDCVNFLKGEHPALNRERRDARTTART